MSSFRAVCVLLTVAFLLSIGLGCKQMSDRVRELTGGDSPFTEPLDTNTKSEPEPLTEEAALIKKTNFYITECFNRYSNSIVGSHNRYASWLRDVKTGPTGRETLVYGLYEISGDGSDCEKAVASAKAAEPSMPAVEQAADAYVAAIKTVIGRINGIHKYYDQEDYKDDKFERGKQEHTGLMEAFTAFQEANEVFAIHVDKLEDDAAESELARLRNEPAREYEATVVETGIKAKKIKHLVQTTQFDLIKPDELSPLIDEFDKSVEQLRATSSKNPLASLYISACDDFTKASKEMMRRVRDGKKFSSTEQRQIAMGAGWMVEGSSGKVIKAYNDMVQRRGMSRIGPIKLGN